MMDKEKFKQGREPRDKSSDSELMTSSSQRKESSAPVGSNPTAPTKYPELEALERYLEQNKL